MISSQPKILVYSPKQAEEYTQSIRDAGFQYVQTATTFEEAKKHLPNTEVILGWKFPANLLNTPDAYSVRWFQSMGAGVDDLAANKSIPDSVILTRIVDQFGSYISEYVFTYLLHLVKNVPRMQLAQKQRRWDPFITDTLEGKTIGVAGLGSIGAEIVHKARAFNMHVHGLSSSGKHADLVDVHYTSEQWAEFVKDLDYLVLTLPLTDSTRQIINQDILLTMKKDAFLLNVGRGALINESDLVSVIQADHLQAAILDVFETEPLPNDHPFYSLANVYVTSHLSGPSTVEGVSRFFIENLKLYMQQEPLLGIVDRKRGY